MSNRKRWDWFYSNCSKPVRQLKFTFFDTFSFYILVDCKLSEWSNCSEICGSGNQTRTVEIEGQNGGKNCTGILIKNCNLGNCKGKFNISNIKDCEDIVRHRPPEF